MHKLATFAAAYSAAAFFAVLILPEGALLPLGGLCALAACVLAVLKRLLPQTVRRRALLCAAGMSLGLVWTSCYGHIFLDPAQELDDRTVMLTGTVTDWPQEEDYGAKVTVRAHLEGGVDVTALLYIDKDYLHLRPGDRITTIAHCSIATHSVRGEEISYYTAKGVFLTARAYGDMQVDRPEHTPVSALAPMLSRALNDSAQRVFPSDTPGLFRALITGDKSGLNESFQTELQRTGLSHVVVVSGMHLAYLASMIAFVLGPGRKRTAFATVLFVLLVAAMAGFTPSVVRASVMLIMLQLAPLLGRQGDSPTSLALALLVLLIQNPYCAASTSLQLSFGAVCGILLFATPLRLRMMRYAGFDAAENRMKRMWNSMARFGTGIIATSLGAMVFTVPVLVFTFGKVSLISPIANLLCLWAVSFAYLSGMAVACLGILWPAAGQMLGVLAAPFVRYLNGVIGGLAQITFASVPVTGFYYTAWLVFLYSMIVLAILLPGKKRWSLPILSGGIVLLLAVWLTGREFRAGELTVHVLDVGQGQSVLLHCQGEYALVDCGGDSYTNAGDIAADQLEATGRSRLDCLIVSHYHDDHANGVPQLLRRVDVERIYLPDVADDTGLRREIELCAREHGTQIVYVTRQQMVAFGRTGRMTVYPPFGKEDVNELGLTVLCSSGDYDVLMTGDMGAEMETLLVQRGSLPDVELMVAGHHGSKYSNSEYLLEQIRPDAVVFSVGINNSYGHPAPDVLERCRSVGAKLYRTDLMGAVTIHVDDRESGE